jgi:hypothetical protein
MITRRVAIRDFLRVPLALGFSALIPSLAGCGGEPELPVLPSNKPKDELQKEIDNPLGVPIKTGPKSKTKTVAD